MLFALLSCSSLGGFGAVDDAALVTCDDGSQFAILVASRQTCRPDESVDGDATFCQAASAVSGSNCDGRVQSDKHEVLTLSSDADGRQTARVAPCATDPDHPDWLQDEEVDVSWSVVEQGGGTATLELDGDVRGQILVEDCR